MKKFQLRKLTVTLLAALFIAGSALPCAAAESKNYSSFLVFGDSISEGATLPGNIYTRKSYGTLVAELLKLGKDNGYGNYAVGGYKAADIFAMMKKHEDEISKTDLILVTDGGNDIMHEMLEIVMEESKMTSYDLQGAVNKLVSSGDTAKWVEVFQQPENVAKINSAYDTYKKTLAESIKYLREKNADCKIGFITQYNPTSGLTGMDALVAYCDSLMVRLNEVIKDVCKDGNCTVVDIYPLFNNKGTSLTNIVSMDIHPNAAGHKVIADECIKVFGLTAPAIVTAEPETTAAPATTAEPETTAVPATTAEPETTVAPETKAETAALQTDAATTAEQTDNVSPAPARKNTVLLIVILVLAVVAIAAVTVILVKKKK